MSAQALASNPKFTVRYTLGLFLISNWLYNTLITGQDGIADFSTISDEVFNDKMFYVGAYNQIAALVADINNPAIMGEMMDARTFLLDKHKLKEMLKINPDKMKELAEQGVGVYDMLVAKKLAENTIFDEDVVPQTYTVIDGSDKTAQDLAIPISLVFTVSGELLERLEKLLDMDNTSIVKEVIGEIQQDSKMACFKASLSFLEKIDSAVV